MVFAGSKPGMYQFPESLQGYIAYKQKIIAEAGALAPLAIEKAESVSVRRKIAELDLADRLYDQGADANAENDRRIWGLRINDAGAWEGGRHRAGIGFGPQPGSWYPEVHRETRTDSIRSKPEVVMGDANAEATGADRVGQQIQSALKVSARPSVDNASLRETLALVNAIKSGLQGIGGMAQEDHSSVSRAMNRNFTGKGVVP